MLQTAFGLRKRLPVVLQSESAECGLACLSMATGYFGSNVDLIDLRRRFPEYLNGTSLEDLSRIAVSLDLRARALKVPINRLKELSCPAILHWDLSHFVVLESARGNKFFVHDPAVGIRKLSQSEIGRHYTGVALELVPAPTFQKKKSEDKLRLIDLARVTDGLWGKLSAILFVSLIVQLIGLLRPAYLQLVIDQVLISGDLSLLLLISGVFVLVVFAWSGFEAIRASLAQGLAAEIGLSFGDGLVRHLLTLPVDFFQRRHMGDVLSRFVSLNFVRDILSGSVARTIIDGFMALAVGIVLFLYSVALGLVVIGIVVCYLLLRLVFLPSHRQRIGEEVHARAMEQSNLIETIRAIETIKVMSLEYDRHKAWQRLYTNFLNTGVRTGNIVISYSAIERIFFGLENILVVYLLAIMVSDGKFTIGMFVAFMSYKSLFVDRTVGAINEIMQIQLLDVHLRRISEITKAEPEPIKFWLPSGKKPTSAPSELKMVDVWFSYSSNERPVLAGLELSIERGSSVAITGPSGCGKTTLLKVMASVLQPDSGTVLIDGRRLSAVNLHTYRKSIGAVMQNDRLLSGTIWQNVSGFTQDVDISFVEECCLRVGIHDDIVEMTLGYDTLIGDIGNSLSGGQVQRVLLARALYRKPSILLLDEATSHLDSSTERLINDAVSDLNITRISVAHRTETIAAADRQLIMRNGTIKDQVA